MNVYGSERGSLPLVLVIAIIVAGVVVALFTVVQSSQRSSARDRDVAASIHNADAGVQEALVHFSNLAAELDAGIKDEGDIPPTGEPLDLEDGVSGEGLYTWQANRVAPRLWEVRSVGTYRNHTSVVEVSIGYVTAFDDALFHGRSNEDGYDGMQSSGMIVDSADGSIPSVGSMSTIESGPYQDQFESEEVDFVFYGPDRLDNCFGTFGISDTDEELCLATRVPEPPPYKEANPAREAYSDDGACSGGGVDGTLNGLEIIKPNGTIEPYYSAEGEPYLQYGETYCFEDVNFRAYSGDGITSYELGGDRDAGPVTIHIAPGGNLISQGTGDNRAYVNWLPAESSTYPYTTESGLLEPGQVPIETLGSDLLINLYGGEVLLKDNNFGRIAAGIMAPHSQCRVGTQGWLFGALICDSIRGAGGPFHVTYDPTLAGMPLDDTFAVQTWSQQACQVTGLSWDGPDCP